MTTQIWGETVLLQEDSAAVAQKATSQPQDPVASETKKNWISTLQEGETQEAQHLQNSL